MKLGLGICFLTLIIVRYSEGGETLLKCSGFNYDSLTLVEVTREANNKLLLIEYFIDLPPKIRPITEKDLKEGPIILSPLFQHTRKLIRNEEKTWMLEYGSGIITTIDCKEHTMDY